MHPKSKQQVLTYLVQVVCYHMLSSKIKQAKEAKQQGGLAKSSSSASSSSSSSVVNLNLTPEASAAETQILAKYEGAGGCLDLSMGVPELEIRGTDASKVGSGTSQLNTIRGRVLELIS